MDGQCVIKQLLNRPFSQLKYEDKLAILQRGRPTPALPHLQCEQKEKNKNPYKRYFNMNNYDKYVWLSGSCELNKLYCWPCLLFPTEKTPWNSSGFANLPYLITALDKHKRSTAHIKSFTALKTFGTQRVDHLLNYQRKIADSLHNEKVKENRNILKRLIDAVVLLAKQESSFRGHDESEDSLNKGNYIELLQFLAHYDVALAQHLKTATVFKGTSAVIQNDVIDAVAGVVREQIKSDIDQATFVGLMLDETTDVANKSQMSTVLRFVDIEGNCKERFLDFTDVSADRTAHGLFEHVKKTIDDLGCSKKLVAQTFDGATVMAGHVSGLQTLIKTEFPAAIFSHCYSHRLNLTLSQSVNFIKETRQFFISLNGLAAFFSHSTSRTDALKAFTEKEMPSVAPTRWNFASRLVTTVHQYRSHLINFFTSIEEEPGDWTCEEANMASGFVRFLSRTESIFFLILFNKVFTFSHILSEILQNKSMDICYCTEKVNDFVSTLQSIRNTGFEEVWSETMNISEENEEKPGRRHWLDAETHSSYLRIFCEVLDTLITQTKLRFDSQKQLKFMALLDSKHFPSYDKNFPTHVFCELREPYVSYFDMLSLKSELKVLYSLKEFANKSVQTIANYMKSNGLDVVYSEVYKLCALILTFPSTTACAERSFSALKRIKSYLRATQGQIRLSNLALLSVEKDILISLRRHNEEQFFDKVTTQFTRKERRPEFMYIHNQMLEAVECKVEIREDDSASGVVFAPQMFECRDQPSAVCSGADAVPRPQMLDAVEVKVEPPEENSDVDVVDDSQMFEAVEVKVEPPEDTTTSDTACESQVFEFVAVKTEPSKGIPLVTEVDALELQAPAPTAKGAKSRKTADSAAAARGQKSKATIPRQARKVILNVAECCEAEKKTKQLLFPLSEPLKRAAEYVGRSVENLAELRAGPAPSKRRKTDGEETDIDERVVRETVEEFYTVRKSLPTLGKLAAALREKTGCEWQSASALRRTLKALGFVWRRVGGRTFLLERFGQVRRRARFVVAMKYAREVGREIFYVDESWIDARLDCGKCRDDGRAAANSDTRLVVWSVGSRNGFVRAAGHSFRSVSSKKWTTTAADFEKWFETAVLPNLPPASVVVMDDAAHHCRQADPAPSAYDPKAHMVAWLRRRGVECDDSLRKYVLWELVRTSGGSRKDYVVDQMASVRGHSVLRLPPNVRDLSAGDLVWTQIAEYVRDRATPRLSFGDLQLVVDAAVGSVTAADWEGYCERVRAVEEEYWRCDGVVEAAVDEVARNPDLPDSSDDSEGSVTEDSESESD